MHINIDWITIYWWDICAMHIICNVSLQFVALPCHQHRLSSAPCILSLALHRVAGGESITENRTEVVA